MAARRTVAVGLALTLLAGLASTADGRTARTRSSADRCSGRTRRSCSTGAPARPRRRRSRRRSGRPPPTRRRPGPRRRPRSPTTRAARTRSATASARRAARTGSPASPATPRTASRCGSASRATEFDWGTLKWCQSYASPPNGCFDVETIALDEFGHVEILNHHVNYADERDYEDAVVQTVSRAKPETGWNMHRFGTLRRRDAPARVRRAELDREVLDLPGRVDDADPRRLADVGRLSRHDHAHRHAQGRRRRRLRTAAQQRGLGSDGHAPASAARHDDLDHGRTDGRRQLGHLQPGDPAARLDRVPGRLQDADGRGPQRRHVAGRDGPGPRLRHAAVPVVGAGRRPAAVRSGRAAGTCRIERRHRDPLDVHPCLVLVGRSWSRVQARSDCVAATRPGPPPRPSPSPPAAERDPVRIRGRLALDRRPPAGRRSLAAEGGDPVVGQLGSFTWGGGGSDSPWLPGTPDRGRGRRAAVGHARRRDADRGLDRRPGPGHGARAGRGGVPPARVPAPIAFAVPVPGRWTVAVTIRFDDGDSATWYWQLDVT